jgi:peptidoglycan hydrolase-like protein with peptidoglycan-binding domain
MCIGLTAWLRWVPEPKSEPFEILERAQSRAQPSPSSDPASTATTASRESTATTPAPSNRGPVATPTRSPRPITRSSPGGGVDGRPVEDLFEAQLALARMGISPGSLDGVMGSRTRNALRAFQQREVLTPSGELDNETRQRLRLHEAPFTHYTVTVADLARLLPVGPTWLAKSTQPRLDYETILELVSERSWSHPDFIRRLNPTLNWTDIREGTQILLPNVSRPPVNEKAAFARIQLATRTLQVFDERMRLIAHYPCSIARSVANRPAGIMRVQVLVPNPNYTYDPERFSQPHLEGTNGRLILPPGPNNPVGTVWIGLDQPGYGIHGTPNPEAAGSAESLGCFRLANWNAEQLLELSWVGMPVHVEL